MLRHVVFVRWKPEASEEQKQAVEDGLQALPAMIPEIQRYDLGHDAGLAPGNHDFVLVADFASEKDFKTYAGHPEHLRVINEAIKPAIAERAAVQYWLADRAPTPKKIPPRRLGPRSSESKKPIVPSIGWMFFLF